MKGAITGYIDVAQILLYAFWIFFVGLLIYLRREDKREGYPLDSDGRDIKVQGFPAMDDDKVFTLADGSTARSGMPDTRAVAAQPTAGFPGAPLEPTGDPMVDGVGPASYAQRADRPDRMVDGSAKIVPLRAAPGFYVDSHDPNPIGMTVYAGDGAAAGVVRDVWVDRSEPQVRYYEVQVADGGRHVLLPVGFARVTGAGIKVRSIHAKHFKGVPATAQVDTVTLLEEDKIMGYFGGGTLYADESRLGPVL
jgi:photosynthetic reaction center H subunit